MEALRAAEEASRAKAAEAGGGAATTTVPAGGGTPRAEDSAKGGYTTGGAATGQAVKKQFYGSIELDPFLAKKQFADLVDEVVQQFTMRPGVKVKIAIEIQAESATGFDDGLQRAVKENCNVLKFKNAEFEGRVMGRLASAGASPTSKPVRLGCGRPRPAARCPALY